MADETTTTPAATSAPTGPATPPATDTGAGTNAATKPAAPHKAKADAATLPGGAKFDVEGASSEDFDKHYEILERRAKLAGLTATNAAAPVAATETVAPAAVAVPATPNPGDIRAMNKAGEVRYFDPITWGVLGDEKGGWEQTVEKPANV